MLAAFTTREAWRSSSNESDEEACALCTDRAALKPAARTLWTQYIDSVGDDTLVRTEKPSSSSSANKATSSSPLSESALVEAFENASPPKVPYLQPYLRELKRIDAAEGASDSSSSSSSSSLDSAAAAQAGLEDDEQEEEQEEQRSAMLEVIDEISLQVSHGPPPFLLSLPLRPCLPLVLSFIAVVVLTNSLCCLHSRASLLAFLLVLFQDARTACGEVGLSAGGELMQLRARLRAKYERKHNWRRLRRMRPVIAAATAGISIGSCCCCCVGLCPSISCLSHSPAGCVCLSRGQNCPACSLL